MRTSSKTRDVNQVVSGWLVIYGTRINMVYFIHARTRSPTNRRLKTVTREINLPTNQRRIQNFSYKWGKRYLLVTYYKLLYEQNIYVFSYKIA